MNDRIKFLWLSYDAVDRLLLNERSTTDKTTKAQFFKFLKKTVPCVSTTMPMRNDFLLLFLLTVASSSSSPRQCLHVTNLPANVNAATISKIFWSNRRIVELSICVHRKVFRQVKRGLNITMIHWEWLLRREILGGYRIECKRVDEPDRPFELCQAFRNGICTRISSSCCFKHILCARSDDCDEKFCYFGHLFNKYDQSTTKETSKIHLLSHIGSLYILWIKIREFLTKKNGELDQ